MRKILSFITAVMIFVSASVCGVSAAGSIICENYAETTEDIKAYFNDIGQSSESGVNGTLCSTNPQAANKQLYAKGTMVPTLQEGKTYHISMLAKAAKDDIASYIFRIYGIEGTIKFADGSGKTFVSGWDSGDYIDTKLTNSGWTRLAMAFTATKTAALNVQHFGDCLNTAGTVLADNYVIVEEDSADAADTVKPYVYDVSANGSVSTGDKISFKAYTYDANMNVKPSVSFKIMRSADGETWTEIETKAAEISALNEFNTYTATAEYTIGDADSGMMIKAVATAKSGGVTSEEISSNVIKSAARGVIVDSHLETNAEAQQFFNGTSSAVLKPGIGYNATNCGTNYAVGNSNAYIKGDMLPKLLPNKTYHISFLSKGTAADIDNFVFRLFGVTGTVKIFGNQSQSFGGGWGAGDYFSGTVSGSTWTRVGIKFMTDSASQTGATLQLNSAILNTANSVLFDEYTVLEESDENASDFTRPYIYAAAVSGGDKVLTSGDVLTASAYTFDMNMNVKPSVTFKWQKSENKVNWTDVSETEGTVGELNSLNTYTASGSYTVTDGEAGLYMRAVAVASSSGSVSGTQTAETVSAETGEIAPKTPSVTAGEVNILVSDENHGGKPSATGYAAVEVPSGFQIVSYGVMLTSSTEGLIPSALKLEAFRMTDDGRFGIKVFGSAFDGHLTDEFIMTPFAVISDGDGEQTISGDGMRFTLSK